jgi:uroporphyrinogen-III synthase
LPRRVWITRATPGAEATAERVKALGFEVVAAPLLLVRPVGDGPVDLAGVGAIAFTSRNGLQAFAARSPERRLPVFAVGSATAAAAHAAGFVTVISADGDVGALAAMIAARRGEIGGEILHPAAAETIGDLPARKLIVYETVPAPISEETRRAIPALHAALVHSAKAARVLAGILRETPSPALRLLCLSPAVAAPLAGTPALEIAAAALPNEEALLNLLFDRGFE